MNAALLVTSLGKDLRAAQAAAYAAVECIQFEGALFRQDIAAKAFQLKTEKIFYWLTDCGGIFVKVAFSCARFPAASMIVAVTNTSVCLLKEFDLLPSSSATAA